ncbi:MAG: tryptophanase [Bacteroidales bacterium]|jgi:tryptophanase|nr:tryptophanase [Bacteroidales bacterium]
MNLPFIEPYKVKMIESIHFSHRSERVEWIKEAGYNLFNLRADQVIIDLLTDSGTGAMSDMQWSEIMVGDESYAGASSYYKLKEAIREITGFEYFLPAHQGRAAENVLFSALVKEGDIIPGNSHFDTTKGHIEFRKAIAEDCTIREAYDTTAILPFKGNIDTEKLEHVIRKNGTGRIPFILITITNNTAGGQPVSMENIREVKRIADRYGIPVIFDSARFAENACFIKMREENYGDKGIREIVREMFSYADAMTMSSKKDAIVNMGGFIAMKSGELFRRASVFGIMYEGFITYGGMSGRDMNALARGLYEGTDYDYLVSRLRQVNMLGTMLKEAGVPLQEPFGGHAIFIDALRFLPHIPREEFPAQLLAVEAYITGGIRGVEVGALLADRDPVTRLNRYPANEFLRLAIPRRVYTDNHLAYVAETLIGIYRQREEIKRGFTIVTEQPIMRHFTVRLARL